MKITALTAILFPIIFTIITILCGIDKLVCFNIYNNHSRIQNKTNKYILISIHNNHRFTPHNDTLINKMNLPANSLLFNTNSTNITNY